jgi:hypothetical protein
MTTYCTMYMTTYLIKVTAHSIGTQRPTGAPLPVYHTPEIRNTKSSCVVQMYMCTSDFVLKNSERGEKTALIKNNVNLTLGLTCIHFMFLMQTFFFFLHRQFSIIFIQHHCKNARPGRQRWHLECWNRDEDAMRLEQSGHLDTF